METEQFIPLNIFCAHHNIDFSFINLLQQFGLIEVITVNESACIPSSQVNELEKLIRMHYEMDINIEGIEAVTHLLQRINDMHREMIALRNKLRMYEMGE